MILHSNSDIPDQFTKAVVALGNFDGVHLGHQELLRTARCIASSNNRPFGVTTFWPHPSNVFGVPNFSCLTDLKNRLDQISSFNPDYIYVINFSKEFAQIEANDFINSFLLSQLKASHIVCGFNYRFGSKKAGDTNLMHQASQKLGFGFTQINTINIDGYLVSSTLIKSLLAQGRIALAAKLSGRNITSNYTGIMDGLYLAKLGKDLLLCQYDNKIVQMCKTLEGLEHTIISPVELLSLIRPKRNLISLSEMLEQWNLDVRNATYLAKALFHR